MCVRLALATQAAILGEAIPLGSGTFGVVCAQALDLAFKRPSPDGDYKEVWDKRPSIPLHLGSPVLIACLLLPSLLQLSSTSHRNFLGG